MANPSVYIYERVWIPRTEIPKTETEADISNLDRNTRGTLGPFLYAIISEHSNSLILVFSVLQNKAHRWKTVKASE